MLHMIKVLNNVGCVGLHRYFFYFLNNVFNVCFPVKIESNKQLLLIMIFQPKGGKVFFPGVISGD